MNLSQQIIYMDKSKVLEFYEHKTKIDPNFCDHKFTRISITRVLCKKCGLGFFDNPMSPFPVEEINDSIKKEKKENKQIKDKSIEKQ